MTATATGCAWDTFFEDEADHNPLTIRREPSEWPAILTQMLITTPATAPDPCSQVRFIAFDQPTPDTVYLDVHHSRRGERRMVQVDPKPTGGAMIQVTDTVPIR